MLNARGRCWRGRERSGDPKADDVTPESLVASVVSGHIGITVDEGPFLHHMLGQIEFLGRWLVSFDWEILRAPIGTGFIFCDYPFVMVPALERPLEIGFKFPGVTKYFPLTRSLCLRMGEQGYQYSYRNVSKENVQLINQNIAVNSERFIVGPSREQLEHVISRSGTVGIDPVPRTTAELVQHDDDSGLIKVSFWPQRGYFHPKDV